MMKKSLYWFKDKVYDKSFVTQKLDYICIIYDNTLKGSLIEKIEQVPCNACLLNNY